MEERRPRRRYVQLILGVAEYSEEDELILEGAMCTEVTLCVLDVLETIVRVISMPGSDHLLFSLSAILREIVGVYQIPSGFCFRCICWPVTSQ